MQRMLLRLLDYILWWLLILEILLPGTASAAGSLSAVSDTLSAAKAVTTSSHTLTFTIGTTSPVKAINFQFSTTDGGSTKPTNLNLTNATLGTITNLGDSSWTLSTGSASNGVLTLSRASTIGLNSGQAASVVLQNITNPEIGDCSTTGVLSDICYVDITTYSDNGTTIVDQGTTGFTFTEDPTLQLTVTGIASGLTHNGITTDVTSTAATLPFGNVAPDGVKYAAQQIIVRSNAPGGYTLYAYLSDPMRGQGNVNNQIDPFGATDATWTTPQSWTIPTGSSPNSNSGWLGANTTDTRVTGWSGSTSAKFGPLSTTSTGQPVATSSGPDRSGTTVIVSYAFGVNTLQPSDIYQANLIYNVYAVY